VSDRRKITIRRLIPVTAPDGADGQRRSGWNARI
jgi:hypothetical protein